MEQKLKRFSNHRSFSGVSIKEPGVDLKNWRFCFATLWIRNYLHLTLFENLLFLSGCFASNDLWASHCKNTFTVIISSLKISWWRIFKMTTSFGRVCLCELFTFQFAQLMKPSFFNHHAIIMNNIYFRS